MEILDFKEQLLGEIEELLCKSVSLTLDALKHIDLDWTDDQVDDYNNKLEEIFSKLEYNKITIQSINCELKKKFKKI